jgi:hypothetical protein
MPTRFRFNKKANREPKRKHHCHIGVNKALLTKVAKTFGVPVYAGTSYHRSQIRYQSGEYVLVHPDGQVERPGRIGRLIPAPEIEIRGSPEPLGMRSSWAEPDTPSGSKPKLIR